VTATLGVSIVLMELGASRPRRSDFWLPPMLATPVVFARRRRLRVTLTVDPARQLRRHRAAIAVGASRRARGSRYGREWRAVADDPGAAALCGVDVGRVFRGRSVLAGSLAAAAAGILAALYYGNISFGTGLSSG
jgi:branched-chain amino acid transport system permease protein